MRRQPEPVILKKLMTMASTVNGNMDQLNIEIRQLDYEHREKLGLILDVNDHWKELMARIPATLRPERSTVPRFNVDDIL